MKLTYMKSLSNRSTNLKKPSLTTFLTTTRNESRQN